MSTLQQHFKELKETFLQLHTQKENLFWDVYMGNKEDMDSARQSLAQAEVEMNQFLQSPAQIEKIRALESVVSNEQEAKQLTGWLKLFQANTIEDPEARELSKEIVAMERDLGAKRAGMNLGYIDPNTQEFIKASSNKLSLMMRNESSEAMRKAAYEGLLSIEKFVLEAGFLEIVKKRNQLGQTLGYQDYYDWRVHVVEQMSKNEIFALLDELAEKTKEKSAQQIQNFAAQKGEEALQPWNFHHFRLGSLTEKIDPYFAFGDSIDRWGRSFDAMNVDFRGAQLTLDLVDRNGKYENGFMHGPGIGFINEGEWQPARINFTANSVPGQVGGGHTATVTLFHEGGHAAHFSNILQDAPCFAHEFAPTSVAYAETQSMFLDSLLDDADWKTRYALNKEGKTIPFELLQEEIELTQPFVGWSVRAMLSVPFAERALYEMSNEELTPQHVLETFRKIERDLQGLTAGARPILSVPHLLAGESSAYYHGYVMAEMAVHQTRHFFLQRDGHLTDNPNIGPELAKHYWSSGNSVPFQETLLALTGEKLSVDSLVKHCNQSVAEVIEEAQQSIRKLREIPISQSHVELNARIRVVHGNKEIANTEKTSFETLAQQFKQWVQGLEKQNEEK